MHEELPGSFVLNDNSAMRCYHVLSYVVICCHLSSLPWVQHLDPLEMLARASAQAIGSLQHI